ncbi:MAG: hypothetical protein U5N55_01450 [Cypionkella sp.]|nr:hypothetical protein [Cypionkella sp.]
MAKQPENIEPINANFDDVVDRIVGSNNEPEVLDAVYSGQLPSGDIELD